MTRGVFLVRINSIAHPLKIVNIFDDCRMVMCDNLLIINKKKIKTKVKTSQNS